MTGNRTVFPQRISESSPRPQDVGKTQYVLDQRDCFFPFHLREFQSSAEPAKNSLIAGRGGVEWPSGTAARCYRTGEGRIDVLSVALGSMTMRTSPATSTAACRYEPNELIFRTIYRRGAP
jgi:hypothetical protein